jgi:tryptophan synthase alpha chain
MSRIAATFQNFATQGRKALIPFITAGDPHPDQTLPLMRALVEGGADIIELGVPFSDPMADGPTIQRASERALLHGMSLRRVLALVGDFRKQDGKTPVVLMGYANPVEAYGVEAFARDAAVAGVDGVLVVDYPPEECAGFAATMKAAGIDPIFLLAPTSSEKRFAEVARIGSGYIYYVSLKGVTGSATLDLEEVATRIPLIRGIRDGATAARIGEMADAVVIGSRIIEEIENAPPGEAVARVREFVSGIRAAMDAVAVKQGATA